MAPANQKIHKHSTEKGDAFRDAVASLCRTKYEDVKIEVDLGGKKVDVVFSYQAFGQRQVIGIECKNFEKPLEANFITREILPDYRELVENRHLDRLIIVGTKPLGTAAQKRIDDTRWATFYTFAQLEEEMLGLRQYFQYLRSLFSNDGLAEYYIDTRFSDVEGTALEYLEKWITAKDAHPLAILGGYGRGKTSLAKKVVAHHAASYLEDPTQRMPILMRLGETIHETTLEGLFGREFTDRHPANFRFQTLRHLNENGRLLIVLDGFDEMKHGMTVADFTSNLRQFNRLVTPNSRVLLLGRPNALPSEVRNHVLRGRRKVGNQEFIAPDWKPWSELTVAPFSEDEIRRFLASYLQYLVNTMGKSRAVLVQDEIPARIDEIVRNVDLDLLARPVHSRIIADLAIDPAFSLEDFTEYKLYQQFIWQIVSRDAVEKNARRPINMEDRLRFQEELAYWAWTRETQAQGAFARDDVPLELLSGLGDGGAADDEAKRNEYLVSTVTDEKEAGQLYFVHRSFQEFLVAEKLRRASPDTLSHTGRSKAITPEISAFLLATSCEFIDDWYQTLSETSGPVSMDYLELFTQRDLVRQAVNRSIRADDPSWPDIGIAGLSLVDSSTTTRKDDQLACIDILLRSIQRGNPAAGTLAAYLLLSRARTEKDLAAILVATLLRRLERQAKEERHSPRAHRVRIGPDPIYTPSIRYLKRCRHRGEQAIRWGHSETSKALLQHLVDLSVLTGREPLRKSSLSEPYPIRLSTLEDVLDKEADLTALLRGIV